MKDFNKDFLCCPACKGDLEYSDPDNFQDDQPILICKPCSKNYLRYESYVDFLGDRGLIHTNRQEKIIRSVYAKFYTPVTNFMFLFCGGVKSARKEVIDQLEIRDNDTILETGIGPGDNIPILRKRAKDLRISGIDIQKQMMVHCSVNMKRWKDNIELFRADAEELPFRNGVFDVVFHLGAFNMFSNKQKAVNEMIRVAKPGTRIVIADESERGNKIFNRINGTKVEFISPDTFIPGNMQNVSLKTIWNGFGYVVSFTKP